MERVAGIEPAQSAWKADVLPLNYTRLIECLRAGLAADFNNYTSTHVVCQQNERPFDRPFQLFGFGISWRLKINTPATASTTTRLRQMADGAMNVLST